MEITKQSEDLSVLGTWLLKEASRQRSLTGHVMKFSWTREAGLVLTPLSLYRTW